MHLCRLSFSVCTRISHPDVPGDCARTDDGGVGEDDGLTRQLSAAAGASGPPDLVALLPSIPFTFPDQRWEMQERFTAVSFGPARHPRHSLTCLGEKGVFSRRIEFI